MKKSPKESFKVKKDSFEQQQNESTWKICLVRIVNRIVDVIGWVEIGKKLSVIVKKKFYFIFKNVQITTFLIDCGKQVKGSPLDYRGNPPLTPNSGFTPGTQVFTH